MQLTISGIRILVDFGFSSITDLQCELLLSGSVVASDVTTPTLRQCAALTAHMHSASMAVRLDEVHLQNLCSVGAFNLVDCETLALDNIKIGLASGAAPEPVGRADDRGLRLRFVDAPGRLSASLIAVSFES